MTLFLLRVVTFLFINKASAEASESNTRYDWAEQDLNSKTYPKTDLKGFYLLLLGSLPPPLSLSRLPHSVYSLVNHVDSPIL